MPRNELNGLTESQGRGFIDDGFLRLDAAFDPELARRCRDALWSQIGLSPGAPETWTQPVIRLGLQSTPDFVAAANTPRLHRAYDGLVGAGRWLPPAGLGSFPVRFPAPEVPGDDGWHVDMSFRTEAPDFLDWRVNVTSTGRALLMLFLFSDTGPEDAPTRIRRGSHLIIARELLPHGVEGTTLRQLAANGFASSADCPQELATGAAGTVYLCHPFLVHAAQAHHGSAPRFMAQPALLPRGGFDPALPPSPMQIAIREACGLRF
ncbi:phytanoyl-CoA dioxygenase [Frigidibacter sp. ROC022]|uniref:phytanoyl-CoA dioxygenase n=1 Tax=Frigidibacter sp. ROC022 TaxID=2971796 RepID=UPI00215A20CE|nr:phytanoyl-CoA dioxygenase [Frigidibacter sp. ROC022]MCR8723187.1 phytanoyl-CoA dioxygenase [Frigidibacter sp. ROC022]